MKLTKLFLPFDIRKNLTNFLITSFSQYTTICFVSFLYSVFNEHLPLPKGSRRSLLLPPSRFGYITMNRSRKHSFRLFPSRFTIILFWRNTVSLVGPSGLEPPTSCLSGTRSNLLSYEPMQMWYLTHSVVPTPLIAAPENWWR